MWCVEQVSGWSWNVQHKRDCDGEGCHEETLRSRVGLQWDGGNTRPTDEVRREGAVSTRQGLVLRCCGAVLPFARQWTGVMGEDRW